MCFWVLSYDFGLLCCCWWWWFVQCNCLFGRLGCQTCLLLRSLLCHSRSCVDMSSLWVFIRLPYESPRVETCVMSLVPLQKASNIVHIRLLSKHFCPQPFFPKDWVFLLFAKSVNLDLQIAGKCISGTLFDFIALSIADKHHFPCEHYSTQNPINRV